jgi:HEAT repeat protein
MKKFKALATPAFVVAVGLVSWVQWRSLPRFEGERLGYWLDRLGDPDPGVRVKAARAVGEIGRDSDQAVRALARQALHEPDDAARKQDLESLRRCCRFVPPGDAKAQARKRAVAQTLIDGLTDPDVQVRRRTPGVLNEFFSLLLYGIDRARPLDDDSDREFQTRAVQALVAALGDEDAVLRREAVAALGRSLNLPQEAEPPLRALLRDDEVGARRAAAQALYGVRGLSAAAAPDLARALADPDGDVRIWAGNALNRLDERAVPALLDAVPDASEEVRRQLVVRMIRAGPAAAPHLLKALGDQRPPVRLGAVRALRSRRVAAGLKPADVPRLAELLRDPDEAVAAAAALALAGLGDKALPALNDALAAPDERVRRLAADVLRQRATPFARAATLVGVAPWPGQSPFCTAACTLADDRQRLLEALEEQVAELGGK